MIDVFSIISLVFGLLFIFPFFLYLPLLRLISSLKRRNYQTGDCVLSRDKKTVTVILAVKNEEAFIIERIENILNQAGAFIDLELVIVADGCDDKTVDLLKEFNHQSISVIEVEAIGKSAAQNLGVKYSIGDILIFTDADVIFEENCLHWLTAPFDDPLVGGVSGHVLFARSNGSSLGDGQQKYWTHELETRQIESQLGILAVCSGSCFALRKECFQPFPAHVGDDCVAPLQVIRQGFRMKHATNAICYDCFRENANSEFDSRVRMVLRNLQGTFLFTDVLMGQPSFATGLGLICHKLLKWFSPFCFLLSFIFACVGFVLEASYFSVLLGLLAYFLVFLFLTLVILYHLKFKNYLTRICYSFALALLSFFIGSIKFICGQKIVRYDRAG